MSSEAVNLEEKISIGDYSPAHDAMQDVHSRLESRKGLENRVRYFAWTNAILRFAPLILVLYIIAVG